MLSRRYLRRSHLVALLSTIILLSLFGIYRNRDVIFSDKSSHHHSHDKIPNRHQRYQFHSKHPTTSSSSNTKSIKLSHNWTSTLIPQTLPPSNILTNNLIQKSPSSVYRSQVFPVIETKNLRRFVHLDLKGAAPKLSYYEKLFPYLKQLGANGLLIEYEDMFPFTDRLATIRHDLAYSKSDIQQILKLAAKNNLEVMPLLQVYGHLEYVLKLKEFMHLREDRRYPQVITPCLEESYKLLFGRLK